MKHSLVTHVHPAKEPPAGAPGRRGCWVLLLVHCILVCGPLPSLRAQSAAGTALQFDGVDDYVSISSSGSLNPFPLTIMGWLRSGPPRPEGGLVSKYVANSFNGYQVYAQQGTLHAWYFRSATDYVWDGARGLDGGSINYGQPTHFAFAVDTNGARLYMNGVLRDSRPWTGSPGPSSTTQELRLGRYGTSFYQGELDEVSIWGVALPSNAIAGAMHRRLETNEPGLLAYWRFNEGSGGTLTDLVPQQAGDNRGTLLGNPGWNASSALISPVVLTLGMTSQSLAGANVTGEVATHGQASAAWFEWGTNSSLGSSTPPVALGGSASPTAVQATLSGLAQGRTYQYRLVATNTNGRADGAIQSFTQPTYPAPPGSPPLRSTYYNGDAASFVAYEPRPEWDSSVPMTIEAWIYRHDASRCETILSHDWPGSYWFGLCPGLRFYRGTNFAEVAVPIPAFKWTHVAVSYDGAVARFHVNGDYVGARSLGHAGSGKLRTLRVGHTGTPPGPIANVFRGSLDEIRLWAGARTTAEIRDGMHSELRTQPGLVGVWPRGGRFEEVNGWVGVAGSSIREEIFGMMPRDLVVPRAALPPVADGQINLTGEYLGADQLVLRYPDDPTAIDAVAYFVHTDEDLFVGVTRQRRNLAGWNETNTWLGLFLDRTYDRPALADSAQVQMLAFQDYVASHRYWLHGDGGGGFAGCFTNGAGGPAPCTPTNLWQIGEALCGDDVNPPPPCTEFRVARAWLGSWDEFDGVALGHFGTTPFADQQFAPEDGFPDSPATWLTMSYGNGSASVPRVRWSGRVLETPDDPAAVPGHRVTLSCGGANYSQSTDASGRFSFDVPMPTGLVVFAQADLVTYGRYALPRVSSSGYQPQFVLTNSIRYPGLPANTSAFTLASVDFYTRRPPPAAGIVSASPSSNVMCGMAVRQGGIGGPGQEVTLTGTNLHQEMEFFLAPVTATYPNSPAAWTLIPAAVESLDPGGTWVKVRAPFMPEHVRQHTNGAFIPSFSASWRWVAHDSWFRQGRVEYSFTGAFSISRPPYPVLHGFSFKNDQTFPGLEEFLAGYGRSAYICLDPIGDCDAMVPDPLYWILWYAVHFVVIAKSEGSCVGMSGTAMELFNGLESTTTYDPLALTANGMANPGLPPEWDTSNRGGIYTRPPLPKDIWSRIRMNHGAQTSAEYLIHVISQLDVDVISAEFGGDPVARIPGLSAGTTSQTVCMVQGLEGGHCVAPYYVERNFAGDPNRTRIRVYDNNVPCAQGASADAACVTNQYIEIDHGANQYHFRALDWNGTALFTIPRRLYTDRRTAPGLYDFATALGTFLVVVAGGADAHLSAPTGQEWGWRADGTFVHSLPGVRAVPMLGSPTNRTRSIPLLFPASNSIPEITVHQRGTNAHLFHAAAGGTMLQLDCASGQPGLSNRIRLSAVSNRLSSFRFIPEAAASNFTPRIGFQLATNASAVFQWMGLSGEAGRTQEFRALPDRRAVEYRNDTGRPSTHHLRVDAVDGASSNLTCAVFGPFTVPAGAIHGLVLQDWPRGRQARSELDLDADGTPDQVTTVSGIELDSDGDGMPDAWEILHQLNPMAADCDDGAEADVDGDGISNLGEYLSDTHPRDPTSALRVGVTVLPGHRVRLSWHAVPGRRYEVQYAEDLWHIFHPVAGVGFPRTATAIEETFEEALPADELRTRFYRVRLVP